MAEDSTFQTQDIIISFLEAYFWILPENWAAKTRKQTQSEGSH